MVGDGEAPPVPFQGPGAPPRFTSLVGPATTEADWEQSRKNIAGRWRAVLGVGPEAPSDPGLTIDRTLEGPSYLRHEVRFRGVAGDAVTASLLAPHGAVERRAGILALHQSTSHGRLEPIGVAGSPEFAYAHELACRGYVVLAPDEFVAGARAGDDRGIRSGGVLDPAVNDEFEAAYPRWSAVGRMIGDHQQALTVMSRLEAVDPQRLGVIGHSLGGLNAWWLLAVDQRPRAAAVSCGFSPLAGDPWPERWAAPGHFRYLHGQAAALVRRVSPLEFHEVLSLAAPRSVFLWVAQDDEQFPHVQAVISATDRVREVYAFLGQKRAFQVHAGPGPHGFPRRVRERAYRFLDRRLVATRGRAASGHDH